MDLPIPNVLRKRCREIGACVVPELTTRRDIVVVAAAEVSGPYHCIDEMTSMTCERLKNTRNVELCVELKAFILQE